MTSCILALGGAPLDFARSLLSSESWPIILYHLAVLSLLSGLCPPSFGVWVGNMSCDVIALHDYCNLAASPIESATMHRAVLDVTSMCDVGIVNCSVIQRGSL